MVSLKGVLVVFAMVALTFGCTGNKEEEDEFKVYDTSTTSSSGEQDLQDNKPVVEVVHQEQQTPATVLNETKVVPSGEPQRVVVQEEKKSSHGFSTGLIVGSALSGLGSLGRSTKSSTTVVKNTKTVIVKKYYPTKKRKKKTFKRTKKKRRRR